LDLKSKAFVAVLWDLIGLVGTQGITFGVSIVLARMLTPSEFGIVGMALVFIAIAGVFIDSGLGSALIQNQEVTDLSYSSVFYYNLFVSLCLFYLIHLFASDISLFFDEPQVEKILKLLCFAMPIRALSSIQSILFTKNLDFKALSIRSLVAGIISGAVGLALALNGFGAFSLVWQYLTSSLITAILLWKISPWRPKLEFSFTELSKLWNFGFYVFLDRASGQVLHRSQVLMIGKVFDPATLGYFSRSESLTALLNKYASSSIQRVFFPTMSIIQNDRGLYRVTFLKTIKLVSFFTFLLSGLMAIGSEIIIIGLFGDKWQESVVIFQILMLKIFNYPINVLCNGALMALGFSKIVFWKGNINKLMIITSFVIAYYFGFRSFLWTLVILSHISIIINIIIVRNYLKISSITTIRNIYTSGIIFGILILLYFKFCSLIVVDINMYLLGISGCIFYAFTYIIISFYADSHIRNMIFNLCNKLKQLKAS